MEARIRKKGVLYDLLFEQYFSTMNEKMNHY